MAQYVQFAHHLVSLLLFHASREHVLSVVCVFYPVLCEWPPAEMGSVQGFSRQRHRSCRAPIVLRSLSSSSKTRVRRTAR